MIPPVPRATVRAITPVVHGSLSNAELAAYGFAREEVLDFSASLNPLGPSPLALEALRTVDVARYPEDGAPDLRRALAAHCGVTDDHVLVGNGSSELLWLLAVAYLRAGQRTLIVGPTYGEYDRAIRLAGASIERWHAQPGDDFAVDLDFVERIIKEREPFLTVVCNPNNPTGALLPPEAFRRLAAPYRPGMLLVDEAYLPFVAGAPNLATQVDDYPLVLLRSMTKIHGLAGLRLGYVVAHPAVIAALDKVRPPWSVNAAAQAAGLAALDDVGHVRRSIEAVEEARAYLTAGLTDLGLPVVPGTANFLLVPVGDATAVRAALLRRGIGVRDCTSFGLPAHIRIGIRRLDDCARLLEQIHAVLPPAQEDQHPWGAGWPYGPPA